MTFRKTSAAFLFAAAILPATAPAEEIWNLSGSGDRTIAEDETLVVRQEIDGEFSGTLSGSGRFEKRGEADLTLAGAVELTSGAISVHEGSLTIGDGATLPTSEFIIYNEGGVIVLSRDDALESKLVVSDSERSGRIVSSGTGTLSAESLAGASLTVGAGTLAVELSAAFDEIEVLSGATLRIGTGTSSSLPSVSGDISLESGATLVFNREAISGESGGTFRYADAISGAGDVVFSGTREVYFTGSEDQTYTGTTTIDAGGMVFRRLDSDGNLDADAEAVTLHSSKITVSGGSGGVFGGNVTVKGDVTVKGTEFSSVSDWTGKFGENSFGAWYQGAGSLIAFGGDTLTIEGDLKIEKTETEIWFPSETTYDFRGNGGGAVQILIDANGAGKIVATGNVELGGTLVLSGADGLAPGQVAVIFEYDPEKTTGMFDQVVYGSDNVTLLLPGLAGVQEGQLGIAVTENRDPRKRASFDEHVGLSEFVDYLAENASGMNKVAQAVSLAGAGSVTDVVNNFSALAYCAFPEMAMRQSDAELDMILLEIARARRNPPESKDGVRVPANMTFFSGVVTDFIDHDSENNTPVYDFDTFGVYAGGHTWLDDERIAGASFGVHRSSAKPHGDGGTLDDLAARAKLFAVFAPKFSSWHLTLGGTFGVHYYDIDRETALGKNSGDTDGVDAGLFAALNFRTEITERLSFTPYLRLEYNFSYVGGLEESGSESRLKVRRMTANTYRARFGSGFEYLAGDHKMFGVDFGFVGTFGERPKITSEFVEYENSRTAIRGTVGERMVFELAPKLSVELGDGWSLDAAWRVQCSFGGSFGQSFGLGVSKQF